MKIKLTDGIEAYQILEIENNEHGTVDDQLRELNAKANEQTANNLYWAIVNSNNCYTNGNCETCPRRIVDNRTTLDVENESAAEMLNWMFAGWLVVAAIGLIILTGLYL